MQTLYETTGLATWFLFIMADAYFLYLFEFVKNVAYQPLDYQPSQEEGEANKQKFIGMSLWLIGLCMALIFGENRKVASMTIALSLCTVGESIIMKM